MSTALVEMFKHNVWANLEVIAACENLTDDQLSTTIPGTYGTIRDTLVHLVGAEERYIARLIGGPRPPFREQEAFMGFEELSALAKASGEVMLKLAEQETLPEFVRSPVNGQPTDIASNLLFLQAINHATEHRAHINSGLTYLGIDPCSVDGWAYGSTHDRIRTVEQV